MNVLNEFKIQFSGLKLGEHEFDLVADNRFFEAIGNPSGHSGEVKISLTLLKQPHMLELMFDMNGWLNSECDRCSAPYKFPVSTTAKLYVKIGSLTGDDGESELDDNIVTLSQEAHEVDVAQYVFENIVLALPLRSVPCEDLGQTDLCDHDVLARLNQHAPTKAHNPMWDALNNLKDRLND